MFQEYDRVQDPPLQPNASNVDISLSSELNIFYACNSWSSTHQHSAWVGAPFTPISLSECDIRRPFKPVNTKKAAGPDGISGWVLTLCADHLVPMFTVIFILSLGQYVIPIILKEVLCICFSLPSTLDPIQFVYWLNQSTENAIAHFYTTLSYLDRKARCKIPLH